MQQHDVCQWQHGASGMLATAPLIGADSSCSSRRLLGVYTVALQQPMARAHHVCIVGLVEVPPRAVEEPRCSGV
jgi:hypothetical protein